MRAGDRHGRLFCLPAETARGSLAETFEWMEIELNNVVAKAAAEYLRSAYLRHASGYELSVQELDDRGS